MNGRALPDATALLASGGAQYHVVDLPRITGAALPRLPYLHRILLENLLRRSADNEQAISAIPDWLHRGRSEAEIPFHPTRVLMHDTTCGPALVDIAAARAALAEAGGDPARLSPVLPVDVSTDHSIAVDDHARSDALARNMAREYARNSERYRFMKWAAQALSGVRIHPPGTGIMHTINLECLASVVATERIGDALWAMPDTLIGTDSHTPMINGLGVLGWGVGGLEAESVMFGMPVMLRVPDVVGVRLTGALRDGVLATDLALAVTERLRRIDLSSRFVEFFGPGVATLSVGQRAVVANMAPEYGASSGYFPIDMAVLDYLAATGRSADQVTLVRDYALRQGMWFDPDATATYTDVIDIDLGAIAVSLAGPRRPQDRLSPAETRKAIVNLTEGPESSRSIVAIAAITSCTNTSDPALLIAAGLLARKARSYGLRPPPWVKTSLAPGSPTAERLLHRAGLLEDLQALGFSIIGYGCTTCIGNSGPLTAPAEDIIRQGATPVAVLSGNRNFPGRVHPRIDAAFLASPPMVLAYALAGDVDRDILADPLAIAPNGMPVLLASLWPSGAEIDAALAEAHRSTDYAAAYTEAEASASWCALDAPSSVLFPWDDNSSYIRRPPFAAVQGEQRLGHYRAHPLLVLGDDITTDHISPAGAVPAGSEAACYLLARGEDANDLNVFAARRGNWEAMLRGLFTNASVRNLLAPGLRPGETIHAPSGDTLPLFKAAERYRAEGTPVVIVAGERYGMGSSRDWAAKGPCLLGVRAVLATGFERIHRSNLVNMGILPLRLPPERHPERLALRPGDLIELNALPENLRPHATVPVAIHRCDGNVESFTARTEIETRQEIETLATGGMIPLILQRALEA